MFVAGRQLQGLPLHFNALMLRHACDNLASLREKAGQHYTDQAKANAFKVLGSLAALGNPVGVRVPLPLIRFVSSSIN